MGGATTNKDVQLIINGAIAPFSACFFNLRMGDNIRFVSTQSFLTSGTYGLPYSVEGKTVNDLLEICMEMLDSGAPFILT